jgi:hypothetical protein
MGVPKLFRWLAERYPLIVHSSNNLPAPEFDNLYLDINSVIHHCTHSNDEIASLSKSEKEVASSIFGYIETLFGIAKPQKLLFIAVDGLYQMSHLQSSTVQATSISSLVAVHHSHQRIQHRHHYHCTLCCHGCGCGCGCGCYGCYGGYGGY